MLSFCCSLLFLMVQEKDFDLTQKPRKQTEHLTKCDLDIPLRNPEPCFSWGFKCKRTASLFEKGHPTWPRTRRVWLSDASGLCKPLGRVSSSQKWWPAMPGKGRPNVCCQRKTYLLVRASGTTRVGCNSLRANQYIKPTSKYIVARR